MLCFSTPEDLKELVEIWLLAETVEAVSVLANGLGFVDRLNDVLTFRQKSSFYRLYSSNLRLNAYSAKEWPDSSRV